MPSIKCSGNSGVKELESPRNEQQRCIDFSRSGRSTIAASGNYRIQSLRTTSASDLFKKRASLHHGTPRNGTLPYFTELCGTKPSYPGVYGLGTGLDHVPCACAVKAHVEVRYSMWMQVRSMDQQEVSTTHEAVIYLVLHNRSSAL